MSTTVNDNETLQVIRDAVDSATVGSVFGTPIVQDGLTVVPVAKIGGGGGGGGGTGRSARHDLDVRWQPAQRRSERLVDRSHRLPALVVERDERGPGRDLRL